MRFWADMLRMFIIYCVVYCGGCAGGNAVAPGKLGDIPEFPWPPPKASAFDVLPRQMLVPSNGNSVITLEDVAHRLEVALMRAGYFEHRYFAVRDGFALVSRIEQINDDGAPLKSPDRFSIECNPSGKFTLLGYIRALFKAEKGKYRLFVFIVTTHDSAESGYSMPWNQAKEWIHMGSNRLPGAVAKNEYDESYVCTANVYVFEKFNAYDDIVQVYQSPIQGRNHLEKAGIWMALEHQP